MRTINASILAQLQAEELRPFFLLSWTIDGTAFGYTDCDVPLNAPVGELVVNGNMEIDDNWTGYASSDEQSNVKAHLGTYSWKVVTVADNQGVLSDTFSTVTGVRYELSVWVYPVDQDLITIGTRSGDGATAWHVHDFAVTLGTWNLVTHSFTETAGGNSAFFLIQSATGHEASTFYFDEVSVTPRNVYSPLGFKFTNIRYSINNIVDKVDIEIDNLDQVQTAIFVGGTPQGSDVVLSLVVLDADLKIVNGSAVTLFEGEIDTWKLNERKLTVTVTSIFYNWGQRTLSKHSPSCRWKAFKGTECAYAGGVATCDRTYAKCVTLANTTNYGGFRWLPSIVDREIWWGRVQGEPPK